MGHISFSEAKDYINNYFAGNNVPNFLNHFVKVMTPRNISIAAAGITLIAIAVFLVNKINSIKSSKDNGPQKPLTEIQNLFAQLATANVDLDKLFKKEEATFNKIINEIPTENQIRIKYDFNGGKLALFDYTNKNVYLENSALNCGKHKFDLLLRKNDYTVITFTPQNEPEWIYFVQFSLNSSNENSGVNQPECSKVLAKWFVG